MPKGQQNGGAKGHSYIMPWNGQAPRQELPAGLPGPCGTLSDLVTHWERHVRHSECHAWILDFIHRRHQQLESWKRKEGKSSWITNVWKSSSSWLMTMKFQVRRVDQTLLPLQRHSFAALGLPRKGLCPCSCIQYIGYTRYCKCRSEYPRILSSSWRSSWKDACFQMSKFKFYYVLLRLRRYSTHTKTSMTKRSCSLS